MSIIETISIIPSNLLEWVVLVFPVAHSVLCRRLCNELVLLYTHQAWKELGSFQLCTTKRRADCYNQFERSIFSTKDGCIKPDMLNAVSFIDAV